MVVGKGRGGVGNEGWLMDRATVSPTDLLKNPMILIAIVGLGFVFGMPYLLDNSMPLFALFIHPLQWLCFATKVSSLTLYDSSGSRNEGGIRRTTEEEHSEGRSQCCKSFTELRYGGLDGWEDGWECGAESGRGECKW